MKDSKRLGSLLEQLDFIVVVCALTGLKSEIDICEQRNEILKFLLKMSIKSLCSQAGMCSGSVRPCGEHDIADLFPTGIVSFKPVSSICSISRF